MLFTRHGGTIINVDVLGDPYTVGKTGIVKGAGELTAFDRTGNTYGMEAWVYVRQSDKAGDFARPGRSSIGYRSISPQTNTIDAVDDERMEDDRGIPEIPPAAQEGTESADQERVQQRGT